MRVVLRDRIAPDGNCYPSLQFGREYEVLGISGDHYRLLNAKDRYQRSCALKS